MADHIISAFDAYEPRFFRRYRFDKAGAPVAESMRVATCSRCNPIAGEGS